MRCAEYGDAAADRFVTVSTPDDLAVPRAKEHIEKGSVLGKD
jgi:hypothetical protein